MISGLGSNDTVSTTPLGLVVGLVVGVAAGLEVGSNLCNVIDQIAILWL